MRVATDFRLGLLVIGEEGDLFCIRAQEPLCAKVEGVPRFISILSEYFSCVFVGLDETGALWTTTITQDIELSFLSLRQIQPFEERVFSSICLMAPHYDPFKYDSPSKYILALDGEGAVCVYNGFQWAVVEGIPPLHTLTGGQYGQGIDYSGTAWFWSAENLVGEQIHSSRDTQVISVYSDRGGVKYLDSEGLLWKYQIPKGKIPQRLFQSKMLPKFTRLICGDSHGFAMDESDNVWGWGSNVQLQICNAEQAPEVGSRFIPYPVKLNLPVQPIDILCLDTCSLFLGGNGVLLMQSEKIPKIELPTPLRPSSRAKSAYH